MFHGKIKIIDREFQIGSSNLNKRSFVQDLEADRFLMEPQTQKALETDFEQVLKDSQEIKTVPTPGWEDYFKRLVYELFRIWL